MTNYMGNNWCSMTTDENNNNRKSLTPERVSIDTNGWHITHCIICTMVLWSEWTNRYLSQRIGFRNNESTSNCLGIFIKFISFQENSWNFRNQRIMIESISPSICFSLLTLEKKWNRTLSDGQTHADQKQFSLFRVDRSKSDKRWKIR